MAQAKFKAQKHPAPILGGEEKTGNWSVVVTWMQQHPQYKKIRVRRLASDEFTEKEWMLTPTQIAQLSPVNEPN